MSNSLNRGNPDFLNYKVELLKFDKSASYWSYDGFNPPASGSSAPAVRKLAVTDAWGQTGDIDIEIEDSAKQLPATVINGNKFICSIGTTGSWTDEDRFLAGWLRVKGVERSDTGIRIVKLKGYGNLIRSHERYTNFYKSARRTVDGQSPDLSDPAMKCSELMKTLWTSTDVLPFGGPAEPFTVTGVNPIVEVLASLKEQFVEFGEVMNRLCDASGAMCMIDANDDVSFQYPSESQSGITIKDNASLDVDPEDEIGYFVGPWDYSDSMKKADGFSNRLIGIGGTDFHLDINQWTNNASDEFHSVDRAIQFVNKVPRLATIGLRLSKVGTPTDDILGEIRLNNEATNKPDGSQVGSFSIPRGSIGTSVTDVDQVNVLMTDDRMQVDKKYWVVLLKRGNGSHHFKLHHDNGTGGVFATRGGGGWTTTTGGKSYTLRTYTSRRVLAEASDMISRNKYGTVETKIYAPFIVERRAMDQLLVGLLGYMARQRRTYTPGRVLAPKKLIRAGKTLRLVDTLEGINQDAFVQSVQYVFDTEANPAGTRWAKLALTSFVP